MLKKIRELVQGQEHCVLATCSPLGLGGQPHASLMGFCASPDCCEFWLGTLTDTRKFANLRANPQASLLLDDRAHAGSGQSCGQPSQALSVAAELQPFASAAEEAVARQALAARHPDLAGLLGAPGAVVLRLVARKFQLLTGLTEVFAVDVQKMLDA